MINGLEMPNLSEDGPSQPRELAKPVSRTKLRPFNVAKPLNSLAISSPAGAKAMRTERPLPSPEESDWTEEEEDDGESPLKKGKAVATEEFPEAEWAEGVKEAEEQLEQLTVEGEVMDE